MLFIVDCANLQNWNKLQAKNEQTDDTSQHVITASFNGEKTSMMPERILNNNCSKELKNVIMSTSI
jgi:hypothetical protein